MQGAAPLGERDHLVGNTGFVTHASALSLNPVRRTRVPSSITNRFRSPAFRNSAESLLFAQKRGLTGRPDDKGADGRRLEKETSIQEMERSCAARLQRFETPLCKCLQSNRQSACICVICGWLINPRRFEAQRRLDLD